MIIQCPACHTRFSIEEDSFEEITRPRFHCSRCGHYFYQALLETHEIHPEDDQLEEEIFDLTTTDKDLQKTCIHISSIPTVLSMILVPSLMGIIAFSSSSGNLAEKTHNLLEAIGVQGPSLPPKELQIIRPVVEKLLLKDQSEVTVISGKLFNRGIVPLKNVVLRLTLYDENNTRLKYHFMPAINALKSSSRIETLSIKDIISLSKTSLNKKSAVIAPREKKPFLIVIPQIIKRAKWFSIEPIKAEWE